MPDLNPHNADGCRVGGPGCLVQPAFRIYCRTEGTTLQACQPCYIEWQNRAKRYSLHDRCPACAGLRPSVVPNLGTPAPAIPLAGDAAQAIDNALLREGLTIDVRTAVLVRLYREAFWLTYAHQDGHTRSVGFRGSV